MLSAYVTIRTSSMSAVYIVYRVGPRTLFCGTPAHMGRFVDFSPSTTTQNVLSFKMLLTDWNNSAVKMVFNLLRSPGCHTLSKACWISKNSATTYSLSYMASSAKSTTRFSYSGVPWRFRKPICHFGIVCVTLMSCMIRLEITLSIIFARAGRRQIGLYSSTSVSCFSD